MTAHGRYAAPRSAVGGAAVACCLLALVVLPVSPATAQQMPPAPGVAPAQGPQQQQPPPLAPTPGTAPAKEDGFLDALGRWWDKSSADFKARLDESNENLRKLNERNEKAAKEAAEALSKQLGAVRIVPGRELCEVAPNGSPDCQIAAEKICKGQGFASGKSADVQTSRKCSARAWLSGESSDRACTFETFVVKAACQ